jgi:hypothetical protein
MSSPFTKYSKETLVKFLDNYLRFQPELTPYVIDDLRKLEREKLDGQAAQVLAEMKSVNEQITRTKSTRKILKLQTEFFKLMDLDKRLSKKRFEEFK